MQKSIIKENFTWAPHSIIGTVNTYTYSHCNAHIVIMSNKNINLGIYLSSNIVYSKNITMYNLEVYIITMCLNVIGLKQKSFLGKTRIVNENIRVQMLRKKEVLLAVKEGRNFKSRGRDSQRFPWELPGDIPRCGVR